MAPKSRLHSSFHCRTKQWRADPDSLDQEWLLSKMCKKVTESTPEIFQLWMPKSRAKRIPNIHDIIKSIESHIEKISSVICASFSCTLSGTFFPIEFLPGVFIWFGMRTKDLILSTLCRSGSRIPYFGIGPALEETSVMSPQSPRLMTGEERARPPVGCVACV